MERAATCFEMQCKVQQTVPVTGGIPCNEEVQKFEVETELHIGWPPIRSPVENKAAKKQQSQ